MMTFSSGGPREDGGFKPNITAPGSAISTTPTWLPGGPVPEAGYPLPPGYAMLNGTSMASPQTTGAMALLISAAKQERRRGTRPRRCVRPCTRRRSTTRTCLRSCRATARSTYRPPGTCSSRAWQPTSFTAAAPVCTEIWKILGVTSGTGVYNRCAADDGGQAPGRPRPTR